MASSSRQGRQPIPISGNSTNAIQSLGRWRIQPNDRPESSQDNFPLQTFSALHSQIIERLSSERDVLLQRLNAPLVIDDAGLEICGRFGFLHSRLRKQVDGDDRGSGSGNSDRQNAPHSRRIFIKQQLKALLGDTLSEYDEFLQSQDLIIVQNPLRFPRNSTLCKFLLDGPAIKGNFEDPRWVFYSHAVRRLLLAPGSRNLLEEDVDIFDAVGLMEDLERNDTREEARRTPEVETAFDEEAQGDGHAEDDPREAHNCWPRVRTLLFNKLFAFLSAVVCIINITTALGYVMLMNDPAPPKSSYIVGTLVTWFLTTGMMVCHGILTTGSMKDYARRLVILAMFTCFVVAVVFHFAGASNFASSFLVGITIAILLIQIW